ncbi:MAG: hypothetical protein HXX20_02930 [Chloroflexi bacterium]|nr:hypothetical protein [Chloroflexota bacterium]
MNASDQQTFNQAVSLANAGNLESAHAMLGQLRQTSPADVNILVWFAYTTRDLNEARAAVAQAVQAEPGNPVVTAGQQWLAQWEQQSSPTESLPVSSGWPSTSPQPAKKLEGDQWPAKPTSSSGRSASSQPTKKLDSEQWPPLPIYAGSLATGSLAISGSASKSPNRSGGNKIIKIAVVLSLVFVLLLFGFILIFSDEFAKDDGKALLHQFLQASAAGNVATAAAQVLPTITQDTLKTTFLDPNSRNLRDYSGLTVSGSKVYSIDGGRSLNLTGVVTYKTFGKGTFEANLQWVDSDERWYIVSLTMGPPKL